MSTLHAVRRSTPHETQVMRLARKGEPVIYVNAPPMRRHVNGELGACARGCERAADSAPICANPDCPRSLCTSCCDEHCCRCCHQGDRCGDEELCASCLSEMAMDLAAVAGDLEAERAIDQQAAMLDLPGSRCTPACGPCGRCGGQ